MFLWRGLTLVFGMKHRQEPWNKRACWSPEFFSGFFTQLHIIAFITARIKLHLISFPQFIWLISYTSFAELFLSVFIYGNLSPFICFQWRVDVHPNCFTDVCRKKKRYNPTRCGAKFHFSIFWKAKSWHLPLSVTITRNMFSSS